MTTISPDYQSRGIFNPFYTLKIDNNKLKSIVGDGELKFKNVISGQGHEVERIGRGKFNFQIYLNDEQTNYFVVVPKNHVAGHYGMESRKDSTASSNVNEFLTVYFLINTDYDDPKSFIEYVKNKSGETGVYDGEGNPVTYQQLTELIDKDETPERDILIGYNNSIVVRQDICYKNIKKLYWVPRGKPEGIGSKNPSDVIIKLNNGKFIGYSNKIISGNKDTTPKFNTNLTAFFSKLNNKYQLDSIKNIIDNSWNIARDSVSRIHTHAHKAINDFDITKEPFSESASRSQFSNIAREFKKDSLDFYKEHFYWPFRNTLIKLLGNHIIEPHNLLYFLKTIGYYTFDDPNSTYCPYKLLIGSVKGSKIKDVCEDNMFKDMLFERNHERFGDIEFIYTEGQQSFKISFLYNNKETINIEIPITSRTRNSGGWSGKSLFINSSGIIKI